MTGESPTSEQRFLAVDVCGTLFHANTTAGLVIHHHQRVGNRWLSLAMWLITIRRLPFVHLCTITSKISGFDLHRYLTLRTLQGTQRNCLNASSLSYLDNLQTRRIERVHQKLAVMSSEGWVPVLVSNSLSVIVEQIAAQLNVEFVASELGWDEDLCTGRLYVDLTGRKREHLEKFLDQSLPKERLAVITDNKSDADLIDGSDVAILVAVGATRKWMRNRNAEIFHIQQK